MQQHKALERVTPVGFAIDHIEDLLLYPVARGITSAPIVSRPHAIFANEKVLRVVDILVRAGLDRLNDSRFQVYQYGAWDISCVVGLVEENIFTVAAFCCKVFEVAVTAYTMF